MLVLNLASNQESHRIYQPPSPSFAKLKAMLKHRDKLLKMKLQLSNEIGEYKRMALASDENSSSEMQAIAEMKEAINKKIVAEIENSIKHCFAVRNTSQKSCEGRDTKGEEIRK